MTDQSALPGELLNAPAVTADLLRWARDGRAADLQAYENVLDKAGARDPTALLAQLEMVGFFSSNANGTTISTRGYRVLLFLAGALGSHSAVIFDELRYLEPALQRYQLVREGMTSRFIKSLLTEPGFQRLYICSPWIHLQKDDVGRLTTAVQNARRSLRREPELLVLVQTPNRPEFRTSWDVLRSLGATIVEKPRLHSKLYMREPGPAGGLSLAILGSENLTRQKWIELGIEIRNDSHILSRLRSYFFEVYGRPTGE